MRTYKKNATQFVTAVQINLDIHDLAYEKWGSTQHAKRGDWLVCNPGDGSTYTVDQQSFGNTYSMLSPGVYVKHAPVYAEVAASDGEVPTKEGRTAYKAGDYLVSNNPDGTDAYAISRDKFLAMYEEVSQ